MTWSQQQQLSPQQPSVRMLGVRFRSVHIRQARAVYMTAGEMMSSFSGAKCQARHACSTQTPLSAMQVSGRTLVTTNDSAWRHLCCTMPRHEGFIGCQIKLLFMGWLYISAETCGRNSRMPHAALYLCSREWNSTCMVIKTHENDGIIHDFEILHDLGQRKSSVYVYRLNVWKATEQKVISHHHIVYTWMLYIDVKYFNPSHLQGGVVYSFAVSKLYSFKSQPNDSRSNCVRLTYIQRHHCS
jgi:hypothetical protein